MFVLLASFNLTTVSAQTPDRIQFRGNAIHRWQNGTAEISWLKGNAIVRQGDRSLHGESILVVVDGSSDNVRSRIVVEQKSKQPVSLTLFSPTDPSFEAPQFRGAPKQPPALLRYLPADTAPAHVGASGGVSQNAGTINAGQLGPSAPIQQTQFNESIPVPVPDPTAGGITLDPALNQPSVGELPSPPPITLSDDTRTNSFQFFTGGGSRSVEILARGASRPPILETVNRPELGESIVVGRGGITVLIRDVTAQLPSGEFMELGTISLSADRVVGWIPLVTDLFNGTRDFSQADGELYLEGDIVFRQGERIIYAESMYYNINAEKGMVLNAEAITTIPEYQGIVRLKADALQQVARGNFIAFDAAVTSSRMGVPRYWLQSERLQLTDRQRVVQDPQTNQPRMSREPFVESNDNFVYFSGVPLLYWPRFSTSLERPAYYISGVKVGNDNTFGTQLFFDFDLLQLFGIKNAPPGVDWDLSLDYLSDRGFAGGTTLKYSLPGFFGYAGPTEGLFDTWIIDDTGVDRLGRDRLALQPEKRTRGRSLLRHRQKFNNGFEFIAELGWISDRNFLEQYLENEWDQDPDARTALQLRRYFNNQLLDLSANVQVNDFFTETEQLPQLDHYLLGGSLLNDWFTWNAHSKVGYQRLNVATLPDDPVEAAEYSPLPGESNRSGIVAATRQELTMPLQVGPVKIVPNVSGEVAHYGEAENGDSLTRLLGQAGVKASLTAWRVDPTIQSSLLNVRGLAHKVEWTAEYFYADSDTDLDELPLYDPLDDNAQEQFRRRFIQDTFGGVLPPEFDPRTYALRHGYQRFVASPSDVIADDLEQFRVGLHQRWQTKRGLPGRERIVDLLQIDFDLLMFPNQARDNFGESLGPATFDARYHIGDRVTLLTDGYLDFFPDGLRSISAGVRSSRPGVGDIYLGLLSLEGPINSTVFRGNVDYRLNEKWIASAGTTYDFGNTGNVGQSLALTRIGESLLLRVGVNVDEGRDNVGIGFGIEPRFWPRPRLGRIGGQLIPPPGVEGLE
ncbi:MAG: organic solvent tolerance protein OstA [Planctomycetota bacterium]